MRVSVGLLIGTTAAFGAALAWSGLVRPDPDRIWRDAAASLQAGRLAHAHAGLSRLENLRPATTKDWLLRAQSTDAEDRDDLALEALRHLPDDDAMAPQAAQMARRIERKYNRIRFAEAAYRKAMALDPGMVQSHKELGYILGMQLRRREVDADFNTFS